MFELKLFLAFAPDADFKKEMEKGNPYLNTLFIGKDEYLQKITYKGEGYLGKYLPPVSTLDQLKFTETHLLSLLQKLTPNYSFHSNPFKILILNG